jgi:hypothetical protein
MAIQYVNFEIGITKPNDGLLKAELSASQLVESLSDIELNESELVPLIKGNLPVEDLEQIEKSPNPIQAKQERWGKRLYRAIFYAPSKQWKYEDILPGDTLHHRLGQALKIQQGSQSGLRLVFRMAEDALPNVPLELLCCRHDMISGSSGDFLVIDPSTPIVRAPLPLGSFTNVKISTPLRLLVVVCRTRLSPDFKPEEHKKELQSRFSALENLAVDYIGTPGDPKATWDIIRTRLDGTEVPDLDGFPDYYSIFHFIGHGQFDKESLSPQGYIILEGNNKISTTPVAGYELAEAIKHALNTKVGVKLVILQSCETAANPMNEFRGVAQQLMGTVPGIIAMQYEVTPESMAKFFGLFYDHWLYKRQPLEMALTNARVQLRQDFLHNKGQESTDWLAPVIFLKSEIEVVWGAPVLSPQQRKEADKLRYKIEGQEETINVIEMQLKVKPPPDKEKALVAAKEFILKSKQENENKLGRILGTYIDLSDAVVAPEDDEVSIRVRLLSHKHKPTSVTFIVKFDSAHLQFNRIESEVNSTFKRVEGTEQVKIAIKGVEGEIRSVGEGEIATLLFRIKHPAETTKLSVDSVHINVGEKWVSQQSSPGLIIVS